MKSQTQITITAIVCLAFLESVALFLKVDGALFGLIIAAISGLAGYEIKSQLDRNKK